jgi:hypothetical protein
MARDAETGADKLTPKDVASATAIGTASRIGVGRHKAKAGQGAAIGAAAKSKGASTKSGLLTAVLVAGIMIGMLAIMIVFSR